MVQTTYSYSTPVGQPGGIYDLAPYEANSFVNEAADGAMKFGMGVVQGTNAGIGVAVPASGATAATFEGIVTNRRTTENALDGGPVLKNKCHVAVMRWGRIYGLLADGATPTYGAQVYMVASGNDAGCFTHASSGNVAIKGRFMSGDFDGIALIELDNQLQS